MKKLLVVVIAVVAVNIFLPLVSRGPSGPGEPDVAPSLAPGVAEIEKAGCNGYGEDP